MRPRSTTAAGQRSRRRRSTSVSWPSARPASTTTASSARSRTSCSTCGAISRSRSRPASRPSSTAARPTGRRDAQDALLAELRAAGVGDGRWAAAFGDRPPAIIHSYSGPLDYGRAVIDLGLAISFSGLVFRSRRGGVGRCRGPGARRSSPRRDRFAVPGTARCTALAQRTGVGPRHSGMGRGTSFRLARGVRAHPRRRLRSDASDPSEDRMTPASRRLAVAATLVAACSSCRPAPGRPCRQARAPVRTRARPPADRRPSCRPTSPSATERRGGHAGRLAERRRGLRRRAAGGPAVVGPDDGCAHLIDSMTPTSSRSSSPTHPRPVRPARRAAI